MTYKWIGAVLIIAGCGWAGFSIASHIRREEKDIWQLMDVIQFMENELQFRMTPLPDICQMAAEEASGTLRMIFVTLSEELHRQKLPDPGSCMSEAIARNGDVAHSLRRLLLHLGHIMGRFDLEGQLRGFRAARGRCGEELERLQARRGIQLRSYQTLGLCAGAALAILFI